MRIALIGQAAFGEAVFNTLRDAGEDIVAVSSIPGTPERPDPLWAAAQSADLPLFPTGKLKKPDVLEAYSATGPELCVMAFVNHILPERVLFKPRHGSIQYHPSLLPQHRGRSAIHWAIRLGETVTGVTIFWVDRGIDTGPILLQREVPIGPDDTVGSLYFNTMFQMGVDMLVESVQMVREGTASRIEQDESLATYEGPAEDENSAIDWAAPAQDVYNLIRGSNPQPGAHAVLYDTPVRIFDARLTLHDDPNHVAATFETDDGVFPAGPGTILVVEDDRIDIIVAGGILHAQKLQRVGGKKLAPREFAAEMGIELMDSFENGRLPSE